MPIFVQYCLCCCICRPFGSVKVLFLRIENKVYAASHPLSHCSTTCVSPSSTFLSPLCFPKFLQLHSNNTTTMEQDSNTTLASQLEQLTLQQLPTSTIDDVAKSMTYLKLNKRQARNPILQPPHIIPDPPSMSYTGLHFLQTGTCNNEDPKSLQRIFQLFQQEGIIISPSTLQTATEALLLLVEYALFSSQPGMRRRCLRHIS